MSKKNWSQKASITSKDISTAIDAFNQYPEWFEKMSISPVKESDVQSLFESTIAEVDTALVQTVSQYAMRELSSHWEAYKRRYGSNMYAVYQTATHWASHPEGRGVAANKFRSRSEKVVDMINSPEWGTLLAA